MNITIYSTQTCPYCVMVKKWFEDRDITYTEHLVDKNPLAARYMVSLSGQRGVPFTTIETEDGTVEKVLGFDQPALERITQKNTKE